MEPIEIYNAPPGTGPDLWKVIIVLEEFVLPYNIKRIPYSDIKSDPYVSLNPNGRLPSIEDSNTGVALFESGAIIEYLVETYDRDRRISYGDQSISEKWLLRSWLHFQMSGQGPVFGQKMWFTHVHAEKDIASVIDRYGNETKRSCGVIEMHLAKRKKESRSSEDLWLVGDKCTCADLAFVPWDRLALTRLFPEGFDAEKEFPRF